MNTDSSQTPHPKVFISYSWTSNGHQEWVKSLAERLVSDGVDVVLDLWDLREGQDKYVFMERVSTDPSISKVLAVCDKEYAEKADARKRGVGTESQIISKEIYERVDQKKFVAIVTEYFASGEPCLPTFFKNRTFIDMSSDEKLHGNYEQLVRFVFDQPLHQKPTLGNLPSFILDRAPVPSKTTSRLAILKQAILADRSTVPGLISDYLTTYAASLEDYRISEKVTPDFDDIVFENIRSSLSYRDEFLDFLELIALHRGDDRTYQEVYEFFQSLLSYFHPPEGVNSWQDASFDNYRFVVFELFIYTIAILIKRRRFGAVSILLDQTYFDERQAKYGHGSLRRYPIFDQYPTSLEEYRKRRLRLNIYSVTASMLKERASRSTVGFYDLVETDFILFLRCLLNPVGGDFRGDYWQARTAGYAEYRGMFPLFAKASAKRVFDQLKVVLAVDNKEDLEKKLLKAKGENRMPTERGFRYLQIDKLINLDGLGKF
jgi:hypothetical protein